MPTYQYACTACDHRFEAVQAFSDAALTQCPECEARLRKVYSSVGVVFKGSGFYRNDSRSAPSGSGGGDKANGDGGDSKNAGAGKDGGTGKDAGTGKDSAATASKDGSAGGAGSSGSATVAAPPKPAATSSSTGSTSGTAA